MLDKIFTAAFIVYVLGGLLFCGAIAFGIYMLARKVERKNADFSIPGRNQVYVPSSSTLETWNGQLEPANLMDLDERVVFRNLRKAIMGELSLRFGDRFSLLYKVPLSLLLKERREVVDGELRLLIHQSVVDYLICVEGTKIIPALALFVWNGTKAVFKEGTVVPFSEISRRMLFGAEDIRSWTIAGILQGAGVPTYFVERDSLEVLVTNDGESVLIDRLEADLKNALQNSSSFLSVGG